MLPAISSYGIEIVVLRKVTLYLVYLALAPVASKRATSTLYILLLA